MTMPIVVEYRARENRPSVPNEMMCVWSGAIRPVFRIPARHVCTGLKPALYAAMALHAGVRCPPIIHEPVEFTQ